MNTDVLADLHIHTCASDGSQTPQEIVDMAIDKGIGLISVTDHETTAHSREVAQIAKSQGIKAINGIELSSSYKDIGYDILGYGIDIENDELLEFARHNTIRMDNISIRLLSLMSESGKYERINLDDYKAFRHDRRQGGWKCLHYLASLGFADDYRKCTGFYSEYCIFTQNDWFPDAESIIKVIKNAGGYAILAHPSTSFGSNSVDTFKNNIGVFRDMGIDGVECHYPKHSDEYTKACVEWCKDNNMLITAGSDNHGAFAGNEMIGYPLKLLRIDPLLDMIR